ncbi:MAG: hypothetical protein ACYTFK_11985 [Planctomycetota bacterium]|jgi:hypothetical protein
MTIEAIKTVNERVTVARAEVFERGLSAIRDKVDALNKRAVRHGMELLELRVVSTETVTRKTKAGTEYPDIKHCIELTGCEPRINGFKLLARVEFSEFAGTIVHVSPAAPDDFDSRAYRDCGPICEHCNTKRRRNDVFVLADPAGGNKVVARNCLADYCRSGDAEALAWWAECADWCASGLDGDCDGDSDYYDRGRANPAMPLRQYLSIVSVVKRKYGWLGRTKARENGDGGATADIAGQVIYGRGANHDRWIKEMELIATDDDADYADKAIAWAAGLDPADSNEYRYTIGQIARAGMVDMRSHDGYAASITIAYDMACERAREDAERAKTAKCKVWFGSEKKREKSVPVKCVGVSSFEGHYGVTTIVRFEHYPDGPDGPNKAILVWFASGDRCFDWEADADYLIDATVKGHDDHDKYGKQTKINRVKDVTG